MTHASPRYGRTRSNPGPLLRDEERDEAPTTRKRAPCGASSSILRAAALAIVLLLSAPSAQSPAVPLPATRSATLIRALRARGLASISAAVGTAGRFVIDPEYRFRSTHADRQVRWARAPLRELGEDALDDAVLERVVADDDEAPRGEQPPHGGAQPAFEDTELVVDLDAQGLEGAARGVPPLRRAAAGTASFTRSTSCVGGTRSGGGLSRL